jgi:glycosyltransferase involved in cell wall biosynthesis
VFVGNLSYGPNADAARWLCTGILPLLGDVTVAVVGRRPGREVLALADDPRVTVAADVADVGPWYEGARVAVVPIRAGGGTRTKLIEAFAHRRPVVSTTLGAAGLPFGGGEGPVVVADDAAGFAAACLGLLHDSARADRLAAAGEADVRRTCAVPVVAAQIADLVRHILAR